MADTTKLASKFRAWRFTIGVEHWALAKALDRCRELGLDPQVCGYQDERILFKVVVPDEDRATEWKFKKEYQAFHGALFHGVQVSLICPVVLTGDPN